MKELFSGFLSVSLSGSLILCLVLIMRIIFQKAPRALICILWAMAFLRLLLPFQIESSLSLRPETPVFSVSAPSSVQQQSNAEVDVSNNLSPSPTGYQTSEKVDGWQIASIVWAVGVAGMLSYTVFSYLCLQHQLKDAIYVDDGYYVSNKLSSGILLGYFRPGIFLPSSMNPEQADLVMAHELAHLRRGDNWLKLLAFVALSVHWYNPLVWAAYIMLCRDIEDACDAAVIRHLDIEEKKRYSSALLACGSQKRSFSVCPVAFGEISIRQRILNVLHYRKPTLWICILAMVAIIVATVFFMTDPIQKHPQHFKTMSSMLGKSVGETCKALGISEEDLEVYGERSRIYDTPVYVSYQGITFRLRLYAGEYTDKIDTVYAFQYYALYDPEDTKLEEDLVRLSRHLWDSFDQTDQTLKAGNKETDLLSYISKKTIRRTVNDYVSEGVRTPILDEIWDVTNDVSSKTQKSINAWGDAAYEFRTTHTTYSGDVSNDDAQTGVILTHKLTYSFVVRYGFATDAEVQELEKVSICLEYGLNTRPHKIPGYIATYVEKQTWWDKLWYWLK